ncbi:hypothetical protein BC332_11832 [Capsicum chinense]|nr:hypothetical protein BC332_11832 [Capsicum chinense]
MMQALNTYPSTSKTAEIMARYRPIAPKPEAPTSPGSEDNSGGLPPNIQKSPFLRNVWPQLQARPTRTRKRGRTALGPPSVKRARASYFPAGQFPTYHQVMAPSPSPSYRPNVVPQFTLIPNLVPLKCGLGTPITTPSSSITLPLLSGTSTTLPMLVGKGSGEEARGIDLNLAADVPEELDFMPQLQDQKSPAVITPQPVRPVGSSISIGCINEEASDGRNKKSMKKPEEVEEEVEAEALPAVVSDSNNKVRLTNSAFKEMVGQPECCWLDYMVGNACKRIGGEVMLEFSDSCSVPMSSDGFTCWVKIEWGAAQGKKNSVKAFCNAVKLACQSKDYVFEWRFHTTDDDAPQSAASNI